MSAPLVVLRSHADGGKGLVYLDPDAMEADQIKPGDLVELRTHFGRKVWARVAEPLAEDKGRDTIRLDNYMRQAVKLAPGQKVSVEKVAAGAVQKLLVHPLSSIFGDTTAIPALLQETLDNLPVSEGSLLPAVLPDSQGPTIFKVLALSPGPGLVSRTTTIELVLETHEGMETRDIGFEDVGGLAKEINQVRELVELPLLHPEAYLRMGINPPKGVIFHGPPGVGKTHLALAVANEMEADFHLIDGPEIISTAYGQTEATLRKIFDEASHHTPSIIFVDELDIIAPKRGESGSYADTRMVAQFLSLLDGLKKTEGVMIIGTTNRIDSVDSALRRPGRFDREIFISPPDAIGRLNILQIHTRGMPLSKEAEDNLKEIAERTHGFVGADLMELCREAGLNAMRRNLKGEMHNLSASVSALDNVTVGKEDFEYALSRSRPSALRESLITVPDTRWDEVGGLEEAMERLRELVAMPLLHPDAFSAMGVKPPSGILLSGPPGSGKTLLVRAIASECQVNFIAIKGPEIFSKWLGESEEEIRHIFQLARRVAPVIIFFDQIDAVATRRGQDVSSKTTERVVNQLLTEMDAIEPLSQVIVIAATNRIDLLDPALLRPGRFGTHISVPLPDEEGRKQILRIYLKNVPLDKTSLEEVARKLAADTEGFSGAELESLCHEAKIAALRDSNFTEPTPLKQKHFQEALRKVSAVRALAEG
jgi:transitional endoplasmic reticulum ATPase